MSALEQQVGGDHYRRLKIQPVEYIHANGLGFVEGCIVKYATRWQSKGGVDDLRKIIHFAQLLIELETGLIPKKDQSETDWQAPDFGIGA